MTDAITAAIQREIQQAQQPLLERIAKLEADVERAEDYIWSLNALVSVLIKAFPPEHAEEAAESLRFALAELPPEQLQGRPAQDVLARQRWLEQLIKSPQNL
jgi:hypothetical protein